MPKRPKHIIIALFLLALAQCKDRYTSPYISPSTGYLVVEGFISGNGATQFTLSRTIPLSGSDGLPKETNAVLQVEGDDNSTYNLKDLGNGVYGGDTLPLNPVAKYRLRIHTTADKDYLSDYVVFKQTPLIDSVNWAQGNDGVDIFVNTHDATNNTRYYQWEYKETWHYTAAKYSDGVFQKDKPWVVDRQPEDQIYNCWLNKISTAMLLGSSDKLSQDIIYRQLLTHIPQDAQQLSIKYSILVHQYALTQVAYNYLTLMKKNSESLGSIFDAQPSDLKGNIHRLGDAREQVIGFISAGTAIGQRIFIDRTQLTLPWRYSFECTEKDSLISSDSAAIWDAFGSHALTPLEAHFSAGFFDGWTGNYTGCVDCRTQGGTTTRPSFWPN